MICEQYVPSTRMTLSNRLDKINIRLRRRQFARRRPKLDDVTTVNDEQTVETQ